MQDSDRDRGLRFRYEDDILVLHEYKRVETAIDIDRTREAIEEALTENYSINGARALVVGLFAAYKRSLDEYWIKLHAEGRVTLQQSTPFDIATYSLLQTMDSLFWHVPPNDELWQEETLATLVLCRVVDDMIDVRVDSLTGEIDNFWLSRIPSHEKTMLAACVIALMKYACMPESRSVLWNARLVSTTVVWMGLNGRHPLWFDGITSGSPAPADDCALCHLRPNPCIGLLTDGVSLRTAPQRLAENLGKSAARLSERCRVHCPQAWQLFHRELSSFEALHGTWKGDVEAMWEILRRTYIAAVEAWLAGGAGAREIQLDSAAVGAEMFHTLNQGTPTWQDNTALLSYLFGCAHPHFLWNGLGYAPGNLTGDWLDG
ncbi:hypothetical protein SAMN05444920_106434 [Nonomuraea solani]|uniref:Uncharacterized protein n=1 Tax=Nonomuraea solani TaxID=1144553 RepID=A0A1H6DVD5_9ACTN|nr:hypothetical protein SAMN05444920_106434 [Nonomuraea solani]